VNAAPSFNRIALIGFGLIGGSIARAAREQGLAGEIVTTDLKILPDSLNLENYKTAMTTVPLLRFASPGFFPAWLHRHVPVFGYVFQGRWFDIGTPAQYEQANDVWTRERVR